MREKKLQVFVSSTFEDLKEERQAAVEAILSSGNIPAGMELFSAGDESQMTVIKRWIDESDVYLLILGGRYGSIEKESGKSYTHLEYEYALSIGKPLFAVVINDQALNEKVKEFGINAVERDNSSGLKAFRELVLSHLVKFWSDKKDIKIAIHETLADMGHRRELIGWIRGDNSVNAGFLAEEIARLTKENAELRAKESLPNTVYYSGLSYSELEKLLKSKMIALKEGQETLFNVFLQVGNQLSKRAGYPGNPNIVNELEAYRLIEVYDGYNYKLTKDGHSFYLKALVLHI